MKICFIMYQGNMYSGGQGVYLYYLTRELARMGHEVHVLAGPPYPTLAEGVVGHNIETHSYWSYHHEKRNFLFERNPLSHFHPVNFYEFISTRIALLPSSRPSLTRTMRLTRPLADSSSARTQ